MTEATAETMLDSVPVAPPASIPPPAPLVKPPYDLRAGDMPAHLRHTSGTFKGPRGQSLSFVSLFPPSTQSLRGVVLFLHGIGEHAQRYYSLFSRLCASGFGVAAYDLLAHGESDSCEHGLRAHSARFQYFVDDTNAFVAMAKRAIIPSMLGLEPPSAEEPETASLPPLVLAGMSYGTLVGLHTALSSVHAFQGLVLVAPAVSVEMTAVLRAQALVSKPLSLLLPKARIVPGVNRAFVSRDPGYLAAFDADPLTTTAPLTSRMGEQSLAAMLALQADARVEQADSAFCQLPVLFLMGNGDKVTSVPLAQAFYSRIANADKEFALLDGFFHDLFNDPEREKALVALVDWLHLRFPEPNGE